MSQTSSVIVIGGGAIGLSAAYFLRKEGYAVSVIDKGDMGSGCSLHNAGLVVPSHYVPLAAPGMIAQGMKWMFNPSSPFYIKPRLDPDFLSWVWKFRASCTKAHVERSMALLRDLHLASFSLYEELATHAEFGLTKRGFLMLYLAEKGKHECEEMAEMAKQLGIRADLVDREGAESLQEGMRVGAKGGLFYPGDGHLTPDRFVHSLADYLKTIGVVLKPSTEAKGFKRVNGTIKALTTSAGELVADQYVMAAGSWSPGLGKSLGIKIPVQAGKGYSITITRSSPNPPVPMVLTEARVAVTPFGNRLRFAGTMELAGVDLSITERRVQAILHSVPRYLPDIAAPTEGMNGTVWAGLRPCTPDGLPLIGRPRTLENLIMATGHAMIGTSLAPITGKLVSEIAANKAPSIDCSALAPDRFN